MTTLQQVVRAAIPEASVELCHHILWGRTHYPFGPLTAQDIYRAASRLRRAEANNLRLCDWCNRIADHDEWNCTSCHAALTQPRDET